MRNDERTGVGTVDMAGGTKPNIKKALKTPSLFDGPVGAPGRQREAC